MAVALTVPRPYPDNETRPLTSAPRSPMKQLALVLAVAFASHAPLAAQTPEIARWERQARNVTVVRDDWGIPHIYGRTDADAVFGLMYAQAEDDFNRVETNFLTSMGRMAEAEGESRIWQDLRMKLFIDPDSMRALYRASPLWLKSLMNAWADGLNFYLARHPDVRPRVITRFEPWMALTFSEGSIGGDIERVNLAQLEAFYGSEAGARGQEPGRNNRGTGARRRASRPSSPPARTASRSPRRTQRTTAPCC